jgi:SAM-dependent methyltransferase
MAADDCRPESVGGEHPSTESAAYAGRLARLETRWIRRVFDVQAPYRWNIRRLDLAFTLDVGCGLGRNLAHLGGHGVGIDHNAQAVAMVRERGLTAFTPDEFFASPYAVPGRFDSLLAAHVLEHLARDDAIALVKRYLPFVRRRGSVVLICPQEAGYRSDATHVTYLDGAALRQIADACGLHVVRTRSFPFPRAAGRLFAYNETVLLAERPA